MERTGRGEERLSEGDLVEVVDGGGLLALVDEDNEPLLDDGPEVEGRDEDVDDDNDDEEVDEEEAEEDTFEVVPVVVAALRSPPLADNRPVVSMKEGEIGSGG